MLVSCSKPGHTPDSDTAVLTIEAPSPQPVVVSGFDDRSRVGAGAMTEPVSVSPGNASCTARRVSGISASQGVGQYWAAGALWLLVVVSLGACSGSQQRGNDAGTPAQQTAQPAVSGGEPAQNSEQVAGATKDPRELSITELNDGPGVMELGVSKQLEEVGVLEFLESYIINVPPTAAFISDFEMAKAMAASHYINADARADGDILRRFEKQVLYHALSAISFSSVPQSSASRVLHEAFFEALEDCGRASSWPEVELFVMGDGRGYDVLPESVEPTFGLSYYEYQQLKHECARYAATHPSLDVATRDELLGPQREHSARAVIDGLAANPHIEVPARYRAEMDELLASGW